MTDRAIELNLKKLNNLAEKSNMSVVEYLKEVICRGWQAFFEIKDYNNSQPPNQGSLVFKGKRLSELTQAEYEEYLKSTSIPSGPARPIYNWLDEKDGFEKHNYSKEELNSIFDSRKDVEL